MTDRSRNDEERIEDLLAEWELARQNGTPISFDDLCHETPEIQAAVEQRAALLSATSWMLIDAGSADFDSSKEMVGDSSLPESSISMSDFESAIADIGVDVGSDLNGGSDGSTPMEFAKRLIDKGKLTFFQARTILIGEAGRLSLDRYTILDELGQGGMGVVYKAVHRSMKRTVALKMLPPLTLNSADKVKRFQREIQLAAKVAHPNLVTAYDAHQSDGDWFLVMEFIDGEDLAAFLDQRGPLEVHEAINVVSDVAKGLEAAHEVGIVHRDIKPSNIMFDANGTAKLLDLGLARTREMVQSSESSHLTADGVAMGTLDYMAPEQAMNANDADARSDIYSLGCTLYSLLVGKPPFAGSSAVETIVAHRESAIPNVADIRSDVPQWLAEVIQKMVAKAPKDRFGSVAELRASLNAKIDLPSSRRPVASSSKPELNKSWLFPVAGILTLVVAFLANQFWPRMPSSEVQRDVAKWVLNNGGVVTVESEFGPATLLETSDLPDGDVVVKEVSLSGFDEPISLKPLANCNEITVLELSDYSSIDFGERGWFAGLNSITISNSRLDDRSVAAIASLENIATLDLTNSFVPKTKIGFWSELKTLTYLDLSGTDIDAKTFQKLSSLPRLTDLFLGEIDFSDDDLPYLPPSIQQLSLVFSSVSDAGLEHLSRLPGLVFLDLEGTEVSDDGIRKLAEVPSLKWLDLSGTQITENGILHLQKIEQLESIFLSRHVFNFRSIDALAELEQIQDLTLDESNLTDAMLMKLAVMKGLQTLSIAGTEVSESGVEKFLELLPECEVYVEEDYEVVE